MSVGEFIGWLDGLVWGTVMMVLIIVVGIPSEKDRPLPQIRR